MTDFNIGRSPEPPDEYEYCTMCNTRTDVGDLQPLGYHGEPYCETCQPKYKDSTIPAGNFCELPDGTDCEWVENGDCENYYKTLWYSFDEWAYKKCADCIARGA